MVSNCVSIMATPSGDGYRVQPLPDVDVARESVAAGCGLLVTRTEIVVVGGTNEGIGEIRLRGDPLFDANIGMTVYPFDGWVRYRDLDLQRIGRFGHTRRTRWG